MHNRLMGGDHSLQCKIRVACEKLLQDIKSYSFPLSQDRFGQD